MMFLYENNVSLVSEKFKISKNSTPTQTPVTSTPTPTPLDLRN
jgi:hypothetical protein